MKTFILGNSVLKLPILGHQFENGGPKVLILGGVHGDEIEGVIAGLGLVDNLIQKFKEGISLKLNLFIVPQFNIDGVLNKSRTNFNQVDLNRNLPTKDWSPELFNPRYPPGPFAGSEPENMALIKFIEIEKPDYIISLHSWKPMLNTNGDCGPLVLKLSQLIGYKIEPSIGYPTPGCLGTYSGLERSIPTVTFEIERGLSPENILMTIVPALLESLKSLEG